MFVFATAAMFKKNKKVVKERRPTAEIDELRYKTLKTGTDCWSPSEEEMWSQYKIHKVAGFNVTLKDPKGE